MFKINESEYSINDLDFDKVFALWKTTYDKAVGNSWNKEKFADRARNWTFFGDDAGYLAVRIQRSGLAKLVGMAGDTKSILRGFRELIEKDLPVWGVVTDNIVSMVIKKGFKKATPELVKLIIDSGLIMSNDIDVNSDGSLNSQGLTKYFVANIKYYNGLKLFASVNPKVPPEAKTKIIEEIDKILTLNERCEYLIKQLDRFLKG